MKTYRTLAKKIANELFLDSDAGEAKRLALVIKEGDTNHCAGWCKVAAIDRIEMVVENHFSKPAQKTKST